MILEVAILNVIPERSNEFLEAFVTAAPIISSMTGYVDHELKRCIEVPSRFILLVNWLTLEDHTRGFRGSPEYDQWRTLLHHFYEPFPTVEHYETIGLVESERT